MLILTRRPSPEGTPESKIRIGDDVEVTVIAVKGNQVRFGIAAPRSVVIDRAEVRERKQEGQDEPNGNR